MLEIVDVGIKLTVCPASSYLFPCPCCGLHANWGPGVALSSPCGMALILFRIDFSFFKSGKLSWLRSVFERFLILPPSQASNVELQTVGNVLEGVSLKSQIGNRSPYIPNRGLSILARTVEFVSLHLSKTPMGRAQSSTSRLT